MIKNIPLWVAIIMAASAAPAPAADNFDWSLLGGEWAESSEHKFGCSQDNLHQNFEVSSDRKTLVFKNDRKWPLGGKGGVEQYSATIISQSRNLLVIKYGPQLQMPEEYREWEMRFIGPGTYRWRARSWPPGVYNDVIGVKCRAKI